MVRVLEPLLNCEIAKALDVASCVCVWPASAPGRSRIDGLDRLIWELFYAESREVLAEKEISNYRT